MSMLPDATALTYFYEAAVAANFSYAAKKLNISQPTLSMAIKRLEDSLQTILFYRQKQGLVLTRAGEELFRHAHDLLSRWQTIQTQMAALHHEICGRVVIGCNASYVPFIAESISQLKAAYPALEIQVVNESTQQIIERMLGGSVDVALAFNPGEYANLVMMTTSEPEMTFWRKKDTRLSIASGDVLVICDEFIPQTESLLAQLAKSINVRVAHTNSLESIALLTLKGEGLGILPECFVQAFFRDQLERVSGAPSCVNKSCLIYRVEDKQVAVIQLVVDALKNLIAVYHPLSYPQQYQ